MGLLDQAHSFAQGASNGVASSLTGPVDGLAWLLRKAGVPVPQAPLGGSDWMRNVGLMQEPKERMAGLLGEGIGSALPTVIAGKAPQIANGLLQMERNAMTPRTLNRQTGAIVWHGSPHKFDKFDSSKIGTGEGAQAYGHGLYLAESPDVANGYKSTLSGLDQLTPEGRAARYMDRANGDTQRAMRLAWDDYNASADSPTMMNAAYAAIEKLQSGKTPSPSLYKVDLPDEHIAKMLDWDKPITKQLPLIEGAARKAALKQAREDALPLAQKRLPPTEATGDWLTDLFGDAATAPANQKLLDDLVTEEVGKMNLDNYFKRQMGAIIGPTWTTEMSGQQLYKNLSTNGGAPAAAKFLSDAGIPGIRYWDGGSRAIESGTSNFVVFPGNEGLLTILERNGQGLLGN